MPRNDQNVNYFSKALVLFFFFADILGTYAASFAFNAVAHLFGVLLLALNARKAMTYNEKIVSD